MRAFLCLMAAVCLSQATPVEKAPQWKKPDFCNGLDCPEFKVIETKPTYESRTYKESTWVATSLEEYDYDDLDQSIMFRKLFNYIQGNNAADMTIDMTAPVLVKYIPAPGPNCVNKFEMYFYISPKVKSPPKPKDDDVYLKTLPETTVYARYYPGFSSTDDVLEETGKLGQSLQADGKKFIKEIYFFAGYDSPFKLFDRHNEVILVAKND